MTGEGEDGGPRPSPAGALRARLAVLQPKRTAAGAEPSAMRLRIRETFPDLVAARERGVTWQQITEAMAEVGIRGYDDAPLDWRRVKTLFHAERYARGERRVKRRAPAAGARRGRAGEAKQAPMPASPPQQPPGPPTPAAEAAAAPPPASGGETQAQDLRALLARRRPELRDPPPVTLGPADRRPGSKENPEDA